MVFITNVRKYEQPKLSKTFLSLHPKPKSTHPEAHFDFPQLTD